MGEKIIELAPIRESTEDFDILERRILDLLKREIFLPILKELSEPKTILKNSLDDVSDAIRSGRIGFYRGVFSGKFNSSISRELKKLGASWDRKTSTWRLPVSKLPMSLRSSIAVSEIRFDQKMEAIDKKLTQILPGDIAGKFKSADLFDRTLWKTDRSFKQSVKGITVAPDLTDTQRRRIAEEYHHDTARYIKDWSEKQILKLRKDMQKAIFAGNRYESLIATIKDNYNVSANKAKFLARQETALLMAKFKQARYQEAGVNGYKWQAVIGTPSHPTRDRHKKLAEASKKGKIFTWDDPPITTEPGEPERRNHPGQDYNCRCTARPVVRIKV